MYSDKKAALAAIIIATFAENIKLKGGRQWNGLTLVSKQNSHGFFAIFTPPNLNFFLLLYFLNFTIHFVLKICCMFISNF